VLTLVWPSSTFADWNGFRNGGDSQANLPLPTAWSPTAGIGWQHELPGYGQSTPVILGNQIFVTAADGPMKQRLLVLCFSMARGELLWRYEHEASTQGPSNYMAARAAPTPVVDQSGVYAFFESGDCIAVDLQGQARWHRNFTADYGKFDNNHGLGSSPAQNASHVFLCIEHKGPSYLLAIDKQNGQTSWKVDRESTSSWSSPIVASVGGNEQLIVSSGGNVSGYDVGSGEKLWSLAGLDGNSVPSPTLIGNNLFIGARLPEFAEEGSIRSNCCIDLSSLGEGEPKVAWRADKALSDYASPVVSGEFVYFVNKAGVLFCLDAGTGKVQYAKRLGTQCWGTPIVANSLVYFFGKDGKTQVLKPGPNFELVSSNVLWSEDNPPKPEQYVENSGGAHGHAGAAGEDDKTGDKTGDGQARGPSARGTGGQGGGMLAALMKGDANGDGTLTADEISSDFKPMLARIDTNTDGSLDAAEIKAMADSFAARRTDSQASARDPIVYGAAASQGKIIIRTGTRLYCIQ